MLDSLWNEVLVTFSKGLRFSSNDNIDSALKHYSPLTFVRAYALVDQMAVDSGLEQIDAGRTSLPCAWQ